MSGFLHQRHGSRAPRPENQDSTLTFLPCALRVGRRIEHRGQDLGLSCPRTRGCFPDSATSELCDLKGVTNHFMLQFPHLAGNVDNSTYHTELQDETRAGAYMLSAMQGQVYALGHDLDLSG